MTTNTGGPAFPNTIRIDDEAFASLRGMTLRDHFAGLAMQAECINYAGANLKRVAQQAYEMADAMIQARQA